MEIITTLLDFILHVDKYLEIFVKNNGTWVYVLLFAIIFVETGLVVMPFLPGDSLLFVVGAMCGIGLMRFAAQHWLALVSCGAGESNELHDWSLFRPQSVQMGRFQVFQQKSLQPSA